MILGGGNAVDRIVRRHHRLRAGRHGGAEGRKEIVLQLAPVGMYRIAVAPASADVGDKVLGCRYHAIPLKCGDVRPSHGGSQPGIFSIGFLHSAPADVAGQIHHRRKHLADAPRPGFGSGRGRHLGHQRGIPCRGKADGLRKDGGTRPRQAMDRFLKRDDGDAQPRMPNEVSLDDVDPLRIRRRRRRRGHLQAENAMGMIGGGIREIARHHVELPELFLQRHAGQQVARARGGREPRIAIGQGVLARRGASGEEQEIDQHHGAGEHGGR